ncbi:hypothetical protein [Sinorhizobium fredii]|uniref:hypothetical protein n=1 Tax=Rhizobium fredii TaxID=380 RepID=UPI003392929B
MLTEEADAFTNANQAANEARMILKQFRALYNFANIVSDFPILYKELARVKRVTEEELKATEELRAEQIALQSRIEELKVAAAPLQAEIDALLKRKQEAEAAIQAMKERYVDGVS